MNPGDFVTIHLIEPVERFWGRLYRLDVAGVTFRGIHVNELETFKYQFKREEKKVFPQTFFFPMRRLIKIDLDEPVDTLPSMIDAIRDASGRHLDDIIAPPPNQ